MKNHDHPLRLWLLQNGMSLAALGQRMGSGGGSLSAACLGYPISPQYAERIRKATKGAIGPEHFNTTAGQPRGLGASKLSKRAIASIRKRRGKGIQLAVLAATHGVSISMISRICSGQRHAG